MKSIPKKKTFQAYAKYASLDQPAHSNSIYSDTLLMNLGTLGVWAASLLSACTFHVRYT